jgi:putative ABC transport system permease protein
MLALSLRTLRTRVGSVAGTFVMVAITATVVAACAQVMATALGAPGAGRFAAADAVVRADPDVRIGFGDNAETVEVPRAALLPPEAVTRAAAVPGVRAAVGDVAFPVTVTGRDGAPLATVGSGPAHAHGWPSAALTPYRLAEGRAPAGPGEAVLDAGLAAAGGLRVGDRVRVVTPAGAETVRISGVARTATEQRDRQSAVFVTQAEAQRLSGLGAGFNAIAVRAAPGTDLGELRDALGDAVSSVPGVHGAPQVLAHRDASKADAGNPAAFERVELVAVVASSGGITTAVAVFVVAGAIAFAVGRRRREIALLRAVGATPGQVRRLLLWETALVGLLAGAVGCLLAALLSDVFTAALVDVGIAPDGFGVSPHWIPYGIAVGTGTVVALLASLLAVRRALAVLPGEALLAAAVPQRRIGVVRWLLGLVALGGGLTLVIVLSVAALSFAVLAACCFAIGLALLGPVLLGRPAAWLGRLVLGAGGSGFLAGAALSTGRFRTGAVAAAIALVVALGGAQVVGLATARDATERESAERVTADRVLTATSGGGLPASVADEAARLPGVTAAAGVVSTEVFLLDRDLTHDGDSWIAAGLDPAAARGALDLGVVAGSLDDVRGDAIAISDTVADDGGVSVGQVLRAQLADATHAKLRVAAIYERPNGIGDVILSRELALRHATVPLDAAVFVATGEHGDGGEAGGAGGATGSGAEARAAHGLDALARTVPTVAVGSRADYLEGVDAQQQDAADAQWVVSALMLLVTAMAAFNSGAMAAAERRPELVAARLAGATRRQVGAALVIEALVTTVVGLAAGALVVLASLTRAGADPAGGPLSIPLGQTAAVLAVGAALGLLGMLLPAALAGRARLTALAGLRE